MMMTEKVFELEFTGYMNFENEKEAKEFAYELEKHLGWITRNDCSLYCTSIKEMVMDKLGNWERKDD